MYRYDSYDRQIVEELVTQFRDQVRRRLSGELSEEEFRPLRLMNGLYLQLHAYMLRIAIPYGTLSSVQLRRLGEIGRRWDRGYGHFTTRQNIQFNWTRLADSPDILAALAEVEMHAIQTSGNCIRNTTADQFAGVAADEIEDPRPWCEIIRQWSTFHPEFTFLPRKFKIAVTGSAHDRAALRVHDIGLAIKRNAEGEVGFEVMIGGGQGRTPMLAPTIRDFLPKQDLLAYLEAALRVYNRAGRRDNIYKARIKILVGSLGAAEYARQTEEEFLKIKAEGTVDLQPAEIDRIHAFFAPPVYETLPADSAEFIAAKLDDRSFARWARGNVSPHKQPGYAIVTVTLKPIGGVPGDATSDQMDALADLADRHSLGEIRVTHDQNLVLPYVKQSDLAAVWAVLKSLNLGEANAGLVTDMIACPGLDYCSLANARAIPVAQAISRRFADIERQQDIGELRIKMSGCINACGHHHVGHIGILGVDKNGEEFYQITLGGSADEQSSLGKIIGPSVPREKVADAIETIVDTYLGLRLEGEKFLATYRRVGMAPFKEKLYAAA
ncbi:MAG: nitrite/sulfite reductase [Hypericibacter sp.]